MTFNMQTVRVMYEAKGTDFAGSVIIFFLSRVFNYSSQNVKLHHIKLYIFE